jgi:hypothetical protein
MNIIIIMEDLKNLSLNDNKFNPGTILTEKNNINEYVLLGYDYTGKNLVCVLKDNSTLNYNTYVIQKDNVDKIIKHSKLYTNTRYVFQ